MGKKDIIKIETDLKLDLTILGLIDPNITVSYIENGERVKTVSYTHLDNGSYRPCQVYNQSLQRENGLRRCKDSNAERCRCYAD